MSKCLRRKLSHIKALPIGCKDCGLFSTCLPKSMAGAELELFEKLVQRKAPLKEGEHLFTEGQHLRALYVVRAGSYKSYSPTIDGQQLINGFYLPGKILGLDAISGGAHPASAKALETSSVCEISFHSLRALCYQVPSLQRSLFKKISNEILEDQKLMLMLCKKTAENRIASYLLTISKRLEKRGYSYSDFYLSMARIDVANYLCLANETVSRVFTRLQDTGIIATNGKHIKLLNRDVLRELAGMGSENFELKMKH